MMTDSSYKDAFLSEAREQLDNMNDGILNLEREPDNVEFVNQVFRTCHTLKGNSAMMGYSKFSELSHKMENVLGRIRDTGLKVSQPIIDALLSSADTLEQGLESIQNNDLDVIDIDHLVETLEKYSSQKNVVTHEELNIHPKVELNSNQQELVNQEINNSLKVYRFIVIFNPTNVLKGPKTRVLLKKSADYFNKVIYSSPPFADLEEGKVPLGFEMVISTKKTQEELLKYANSMAETKGYVLELSETFTVPESFVAKKEVTASAVDKNKDIVKISHGPSKASK